VLDFDAYLQRIGLPAGGSIADVGFGRGALLEPLPWGRGGRESSEPVERERIPELLSERFGLEGFGVGPDGRVRALS
jgi:hypothetical protein